MITTKQMTKATAKTLLSLSLIATYATKYGFDFSADMTKTIMKGTENMTDYLLDTKVPRLGIGEALFNKTVAAGDWTLNQAIQIQKALKQKV